MPRRLIGLDKSDWEAAIKEELEGLREMEVFSDKACPPGVKPLETRFVFAKKLNVDGSERYKARLVVKGYCWIIIEATIESLTL